MRRVTWTAGLPWGVSFAFGLFMACASRPTSDGTPQPHASSGPVKEVASAARLDPEPAPTAALHTAPAPASSSATIAASSPGSVEDREARIVCERYRQAAEARDVAALLALASADYLDDGGTVDPSDDIDHTGLERFLLGPFQAITDVHYVFEYERIEWRGDTVTVDYHYLGSYRTRGIERRVEDTNRLVLKREGTELKIVSGM